MMKSNFIIAICILLSSSLGFAASQAGSIFEVKYKSDVRDHTYTIVKDGKKPMFKLVFREAGKPLQTKPLTGRQVDQLSAQLTRIAWGSQYRRPASVKKVCSKFAQVRVREDKADICSEDAQSTGKMLGFLNSLRSEFK
ncbi:MAG: hypothetical protein EOP06_08355 [Proteobacteria bacterium]|nr:MAG: hypothetical protein EOP06_08355 [Pseudomonadota bacterium]